MNAKALILAAVAATAVSGAASAATIYATSVDSFTPGPRTLVDPDRLNTANALGASDGKFLSLGFGGEVVLSFGQSFGSPGNVTEITFNRPIPPETADIYVGDGINWVLIGSAANSAPDGVNSFTFTGYFSKVKIIDTSTNPGNHFLADGFDVDSVGVSPVPVPAAGLLLAGGLGLLGARKLRRKG